MDYAMDYVQELVPRNYGQSSLDWYSPRAMPLVSDGYTRVESLKLVPKVWSKNYAIPRAKMLI
jgi:hypothetical protein